MSSGDRPTDRSRERMRNRARRPASGASGEHRGVSSSRPSPSRRPAKEAPRTDARTAAMRCLVDVFERARPLELTFERHTRGLDARDRGLSRALASGCLRWFYSLRDEIAAHSSRPFDTVDIEVRCALVIGAFQIRHLRVPAYAAVTATVDLVPMYARGFVNAILRKLAAHEPPPHQSEEGRHEHPAWLLSLLQQHYPADWQAICSVNNEPPPQCVRIGPRLTRSEVSAKLAARNLITRDGRYAGSALYLEHPVDAESLLGITGEGVNIQDEGAQLACDWLEVSGNQRILDACAAPGNKTAALCERAPNAHLVAVDASERRLTRLRALLPAHPQIEVICADATQPQAWWDGVPFDRILIDAPCSATGTIRRHPDIKHLRSRDQFAGYAEKQLALLHALWPCLARDGLLVYATCSVFPNENEAVIRAFVDAHEDAAISPPAHAYGRRGSEGTQLLPETFGPDGFFLARLRKRA